MLDLFIAGFLIGLGIAATPGPILLLMISETLRRGYRAGLLVMVSPITVDLCFMVPLALTIQTLLTSKPFQIAMGLAGGAYLAWLGYTTIRTAIIKSEANLNQIKVEAKSFRSTLDSYKKGVAAHFLNPFAYTFWVTVGGLMLTRGLQYGILGPIIFLVGLYFGIILIELVLIYFGSKGKLIFNQTAYKILLAISGLMLIGFGVYFAIRSFI
jgi:threonine/homoserine/homoserine lactone efflux protein